MITKSPGGSPFPWHRDNAYNRLKKEHFQFWIALTDMNKENGGLWLIPKSHLEPKIKHTRDKSHWKVDIDSSDSMCIIAKPGDVLLFSSRLLHKTEVNHSKEDRTAYVVEYMSQKDVDPLVGAPYLFIKNGSPLLLQKHPKSNFLSNYFSLIPNYSKRHRRV